MNRDALLQAIDGAMGQCAVAKQVYDAQEVSDLPIQSIYASLQTLRLLVESSMSVEEEEPDDTCPTCHGELHTTVMGGDHWVSECPKCQVIVSQG